jgi:hypothetical protein
MDSERLEGLILNAKGSTQEERKERMVEEYRGLEKYLYSKLGKEDVQIWDAIQEEIDIFG